MAPNEKPAPNAPDEMVQGMGTAKLVYENAGRKIYNASRISYLDVFEMKNLDDTVFSSLKA